MLCWQRLEVAWQGLGKATAEDWGKVLPPFGQLPYNTSPSTSFCLALLWAAGELVFLDNTITWADDPALPGAKAPAVYRAVICLDAGCALNVTSAPAQPATELTNFGVFLPPTIPDLDGAPLAMNALETMLDGQRGTAKVQGLVVAGVWGESAARAVTRRSAVPAARDA